MKSFNIFSVSAVLIISFIDCNAAYKKHVLGIGQAMVDVSVECGSDEELYNYVQGVEIKKGDSVAIKCSIARELARKVTSPLKQNAGGAVGNVIAGMASLGCNVGMVSARANDAYGQCFDNDLTSLNIEHFCSIRDTAGTGVVYSFITPGGERTMLAYPGVSHLIDQDYLSIDCMEKYEMVLSEGYMWYTEYAAEIVKKAIVDAHESGIKTVFALSSPHVVKTFKDQFIALLPNIDILVGNEEEFYCLCGTKNIEDVYSVMQKTVPMVVITRASDGAAIITNDGIIHVPIKHKVEYVIDTTGAGDIFLAGFLYGQTHNMEIEQSAMLGNLLAGKLIQQVGARPEFDTKALLIT